MNVLFASSEVFPYSKTGGLADIASFLPKALRKIGHNVTTVTPYYKDIRKYHNELMFLGTKTIYLGLDSTKVNYYLLKNEDEQIGFVENTILKEIIFMGLKMKILDLWCFLMRY